MTEVKMTMREFLNGVLAIEGLSADLKEKAEHELGKLDARNSKRSSSMTEVQKENLALAKEIASFLAENPKSLSPDVAVAVGVSTQKAGGVMREMVKQGTLVVEDVKIKGRGTLKAYSLAEVVEGEEPSAE